MTTKTERKRSPNIYLSRQQQRSLCAGVMASMKASSPSMTPELEATCREATRLLASLPVWRQQLTLRQWQRIRARGHPPGPAEIVDLAAVRRARQH